MAPRKDVSEARRAQIIDAATKVFARMGMHRARMDDIVKESGLSKGALYWYFKSKDEIISAIITRFFDRETENLSELVSAPGSAKERLMLLDQMISQEVAKFFKNMPSTLELYAVAARQQGLGAGLRRYFRMYRQGLADLLRQGVEAGEFRPMDVEETATNIIALYEGLMLLTAVDSESVHWEGVSEHRARLLLQGLLKE
ncbi:MAG: TetR/AcrR family transcriptional regulator [Anaerolineales bacterium]